MNFKFGTHAPRQCPEMTLEKIRKMGRGQGHVTPNFLLFWALNANSSKMAKDTKVQFGTHAPRRSRHDL